MMTPLLQNLFVANAKSVSAAARRRNGKTPDGLVLQLFECEESYEEAANACADHGGAMASYASAPDEIQRQQQQMLEQAHLALALPIYFAEYPNSVFVAAAVILYFKSFLSFSVGGSAVH